MAQAENQTYRVKQDGFFGELFRPAEDKYPGKALICFSGSDGGIELARTLAGVFQSHGLTALAYVMEEDLPGRFLHVPIDYIEAAAKRLHDMGYEKVGLWGISKGAELALTADSLLPDTVNAVVAVAPIEHRVSGLCQGQGNQIPARQQLELPWEGSAVYSLRDKEISARVDPAQEHSGAGDDHVRSLSAACAASESRRGDPCREYYRPDPADLVQNGHNVALGTCGKAHRGAAAGA